MNAKTSPAPRHDSELARQVADYCRSGHTAPGPDVRAALPASELWQAVTRVGTELWLDTGDVDAARELWTREFTALTTNNTLLNKEVQKGLYDELIPDAAALLRSAGDDLDEQRVVLEVAFILNAVHGLKLVRTFDADVSVELHTDLANDTEASYQYGKRFHAICPDRFIVKVPLTPAGIFAARRLGQDGIRINFTLGFSARQNYLIALLAQPTFVNVFMGRINAFLADNKLGDGQNAGEKATLASQRVLRRLRQSPGLQVRQIGASMRSGQQCFDLLGLDVFTMPTAAAKEFLKLAPPRDVIKNHTDADPPVQVVDTIDPTAERIGAFWDVDQAFEQAMCRLAAEDADRLDAGKLTSFLQANGAGDLFPAFTDAERERLRKEGKIPVHASWRDRVRKGNASWDGILTAAALESFAQDQAALDRRIRSQL